MRPLTPVPVPRRLGQKEAGQKGGHLVVPTLGVSLPIYDAVFQIELDPVTPWTTICQVIIPKGVEGVVTRFGNGCEHPEDLNDLTCWNSVHWRVTINEARIFQHGWSDFVGQRGEVWAPIEVLWCELTEAGGHGQPGRCQTCEVQARNEHIALPYLASAALAGYTL